MAPPHHELTDVFTSGEGGYSCFRIPSLLRVQSGLILFSEGRKFNCNDHGWIDIVCKSSADDGKTWSTLLVVYSESSNERGRATVGNPAPGYTRPYAFPPADG